MITVTMEWINKQMAYLSSNLGVYKLHSLEDFFFEPTPGFYGFLAQGSTEALNEGIKMLARHIGSLNYPVIEKWEGVTNPLTKLEHDFAADNEPPGLIKYDGPYRSKIQLCITNKHSPFVMGAILAHELTHYYLFSKGILLADEIENERFTDLATVYLGLGKLTLNGYNSITWKIKRSNKTYTFNIGYLTTDEIAIILYSICKFRYISLDIAKVNLSEKSIELLLNGKTIVDRYYKEMKDNQNKLHRKKLRKDKLRKFIKKILLLEDQKEDKIPKALSENYKIILCDNCNQKLKIPIKEKAIQVKCPKCRTEFISYPE